MVQPLDHSNTISDDKIISVGALIINSENKILAFARKSDINNLGQIGGKREKGEEIKKSIKREVFEETGLQIDVPDTPFFYRPYIGTDNYHAVFFIKTDISQKTFPDANTDDEGNVEGFAIWVTPEEFVSPLRSAFPENNLLLLKKAGLL